MLARFQNPAGRIRAFTQMTRDPVIAPYHSQYSPLEQTIRKFIILLIGASVGIFYGFFFTVLPPVLLIYFLLPVVVLFLFVIWALPDHGGSPVRLLTLIFYAFYIITVLWPTYIAIAVPGLPWISFRRLLGVPLSILLLICVSTSAVFRTQVSNALRSVPFLTWMFLIFFALQFVTIFIAENPFGALNIFLNNVTAWTAIFFVSVYVFLQQKEITRWFYIAIAMVGILSIMGLAELYNQKILWADHIPSFFKIDDESTRHTLTPNFKDGRYRITTTFSVPLSFAEYLALMSPIFLYMVSISRGLFTRAMWLMADVGLLVMIYLTTARLGMVGYIAGHAFFGMIWSLKRWRSKKGDILGPAISIAYPVLLVVGATAITTIDALRYRIYSGGSSGISDDGRKAQLAMAPPVIMRNPFGYGPGQGGSALGFTTPGGQLTVDSYFLTIVLDYGIAGFLVFYGMILSGVYWASRLSFRTRTAEIDFALPVATMMFIFFVTKSVLSQEDNHSILFMLLGMTAALQYKANQHDKRPDT